MMTELFGVDCSFNVSYDLINNKCQQVGKI